MLEKRDPLPPISILKDVCVGHDARHIVFVTTHWDQVSIGQGKKREAWFKKQLSRLLVAGARTERFNMTTESARSIIGSVVLSDIIRTD